MRLYHPSTEDAARAILAHGFRDAWGYYLTDCLWYGVWLSEAPDKAPNGTGDIILAVDVDVPDAAMAQYAWVDLGKSYREFLVSAEFLNRHATISLVVNGEEEVYT